MFNRIKNYIEDGEFHFDIFEDRIHVVNYQEILSVGNDKITISSKKQRVYFYGNSFSLSKLIDNELLIEGKLFKVEVIYE